MKPLVSALAALLLLGCQQSAPGPFADTAFVNGVFYTGANDGSLAKAVAIEGEKFVYVGDDATAWIGPDTEVHDLGGRMAIPGLLDGHTHPGLVALSHRSLLLEDTSSLAATLDSIRKIVADNPEREVLIGGYWPNELFGPGGPHKSLLDEIEPDRPLILYDSWAHTVWANSAALSQAGVSGETEDLVPGFAFYQKDEHGEPTGWITESAASLFVNKFQEVTPEVEQVLLEYLEYFRSMGVTTLLDAGNFGLDEKIYAAVRRLDDAGKLPLRYHGSYTLFVPRDLDKAVSTVTALNQEFGSENLRIDTLKVFFDGVIETRTAAMSEDYLDTPGNRGEALLSRQQMHELILELEQAGYNLHVHAVGNRATSTTLDAVEDANRSLGRPTSIRITICHLELVKETDQPRFGALGVIGNFTPHWWVGGDFSWQAAGIGEMSLTMQRARPLLEGGAKLTFSSDNTDTYEWRSGRSNPFVGIEMGHNRQDVGTGESGDVMPPIGERLSRKVMLDGYSKHSAYQLGRENELGRIAPGLRADLVVLDRHLLDVNRFDIHRTRPLAVVMDGKLVSGSTQ